MFNVCASGFGVFFRVEVLGKAVNIFNLQFHMYYLLWESYWAGGEIHPLFLFQYVHLTLAVLYNEYPQLNKITNKTEAQGQHTQPPVLPM